ncbi:MULTISPECIES: hypothetical protein [unclassified Tolypothrix]|uniref:hypothetical protein n=1 Tax=unclassified Tolypothrix TaxID=2649714 RepID=UPI0005F78012|nr:MULTISPECIES: hypothetical protein [unclassified Tolypothrix]MBE9082909.1 hypothetical protein [Tolypothrix sp. LEGE 11397]UYD24079.1 hypothetical protein HGR01_21560 [Tolypothrix sp. PCC 7712]UYD33691.1 hypothetical protein HG267_33170 [Tolypothrix sp. PCC 7601]BAY89825.1 hypothetical protein NIES3275_18280 [Microchaete diplosiphon NIES-3275]
MNESKPIDFIELLLNDEVGTSVWNWVKKDQRSEHYFIPVVTDNNRLTTDYSPMFLFKMKPGESWGLGERVQIQLKAGIFKYQGVVAVYLLFLFPGIDFIHEVWINHYTNLENTFSPLFQLQQMKQISLLLYEIYDQPERVIKIANNLDWARLIANIQTASPWTDVQFDAAKTAAPPSYFLWNLKSS